MLMFGGAGFGMAYFAKDVPPHVLFMFGGLSITLYTVFYLAIFGLDEVKWMFINAGLGLLGIYTEVGWLLSLFHKKIEDYSFAVHIVPFLFFVLYTFLIRHAVLDMTGAREDKQKKTRVEIWYVVVSVVLSAIAFWLEHR